MLVVNHYILDRFERDVNDVFDVVEALVGGLLASCLLEVETQVLNGPLGAVLVVVLLGVLLDSDVRQMHHHVIQLIGIRRVLLMAEAREAERAQPGFHRAIAGDQYVYAQIELLAAD